MLLLHALKAQQKCPWVAEVSAAVTFPTKSLCPCHSAFEVDVKTAISALNPFVQRVIRRAPLTCLGL
jgi:hypothetical protein